MELGIYEEDLSLFNGDLLDSFTLFEELSDYDHLKTDLHKVVDSSPDEFIPSNDDIETLVNNLGPMEPNEGVTTWMEDKVNLLDILMDNEHELPSDEQFNIMSTFDDVSQKLSDPVDLLKSMGNLYTPINVQHDCPVNASGQVSFTNSEDSGIDLSLEETNQSFLELFPQQMLENMEEASPHPLLVENLDDVILDVQEDSTSPLPIYVDNGQAAEMTESTILDISLGVKEVEPTISLNTVLSDIGYGLNQPSNVEVIIPATSPSQPSTVDLSQYLSLLNSASQSSCSSPSYSGRESPAISVCSSTASSSGRSSPYARETVTVVSGTTSRILKSVSGDPENKIKDKKLRKMRQNKDAATRYRIKKKAESSGMDQECETLQKRNDELRDQIDTMSREIAFLKELFANVNEEMKQ